MKKAIAIAILAMGSFANALENGRYEQHLPDGSTDVLIINQYLMSIELTRQVGGPGGISNEGVVPYPTVCRVKQTGKITDEDATWMQYQVGFVELTDLSGLRDTHYCDEYVKAFNRLASSESVSFSIKKAEYQKVK